MEKLLQLRENIDNIDNQILNLLKKRFEVVTKVKNVKKDNNLSILDSKREEKIFKDIYDNFTEYYVYFKPIYQIIMKESKIYQKGKLAFSSV